MSLFTIPMKLKIQVYEGSPCPGCSTGRLRFAPGSKRVSFQYSLASQRSSRAQGRPVILCDRPQCGFAID